MCVCVWVCVVLWFICSHVFRFSAIVLKAELRALVSGIGHIVKFGELKVVLGQHRRLVRET